MQFCQFAISGWMMTNCKLRTIRPSLEPDFISPNESHSLHHQAELDGSPCPGRCGAAFRTVGVSLLQPVLERETELHLGHERTPSPRPPISGSIRCPSTACPAPPWTLRSPSQPRGQRKSWMGHNILVPHVSAADPLNAPPVPARYTGGA